jgi:hypothetical protein
MIPPERDLDTVTASEWRNSTEQERREFVDRERQRGYVSFHCLTCAFPTSHGVAVCDACRPTIAE